MKIGVSTSYNCYKGEGLGGLAIITIQESDCLVKIGVSTSYNCYKGGGLGGLAIITIQESDYL